MSGIVSQIKDAARELFFDVVGIASVEPFTRDEIAFQEWLEADFAAGMDYMKRRPLLHTTPRALVPYARSLITLAVNHYSDAPTFSHEYRFGRVARYAWGKDYHEVVRPRLQALVGKIEHIAARPLRARCFVDAVPLLERAVAARGGIGFFGKNTNLLQPRSGSWFFLSEILLDLELPTDDHKIKVSCGSCHRCIDACPTDAFVDPYQLDSRRCISYLTIENKEVIPRDLRAGIGEWIFGCDVCQDVCPFNRFASETGWPEFHPKSGVGPKLDLVEVLSIDTDEQFRERFKGTALTRPKRRGLLRNACIVAANVGATAAIPALARSIAGDPEPLVRSHALWALTQLDRARGAAMAERALKSDSHPLVLDESNHILTH